MFKERNIKVLDKLLEYYLPEKILPVYELLRKYPERLRFVKDHNGVKNLVFISTVPDEKFIFEVQYFSIITKDRTGNGNVNVTKVSYTHEEVLEEVTSFFENTNETLFVNIGFEENEVTKDDYMELLSIMEDTKCNIIDAYVTLRRFPEWYENEAELPFYIQKEKEYMKQLVEMERAFLLSKKQDIFSLLHEVVEKNDEEEFNKLSTYIKNINRQLSEYK